MNNSIKSVIWSSIDRFSVQIIQLVLGFVIARELDPKVYGIVAIVNIFIAVAQVFIDSGFGNALTHKQNRTEIDYSTVFYFNIIISVFLYIILYFGAVYIADFYGVSIIIEVARWIGIVLIINALSIVQITKLTINLDFKSQAKSSLYSVILSGLIAVCLVYQGCGVWALVIQIILSNLIRTILLYYYIPWIPLPVFSMQSFKGLFLYGSRLLAVGLLHTIFQNLYSILIGKFFTTTTLGLYNKAFSLSQYPSNNISMVVSRVVFPIFCKLQGDDDSLKSYFLRTVRCVMLVEFPIMTLLFVISKPLVLSLLTDKWVGAIPLLQILCIAYVMNPVMNLCAYVIMAKGRSDYSFNAEIIKKIVFGIILLCTLPFGVKLMCWGLVVYSFIDFLVISYYLKKTIFIKTKQIVKELLPSFFISISMALIVFLICSMFSSSFIQLLVGVFVGILTVVLFMYLLKIEEFLLIISKIK